ncbi:MAG: UDP-N-acetylmuramate--L-alanine ligase [Alphaproteobacteria bacterium]|nr:MAG: UDP-N-acetylmuramate--L-alanine ligase [Alphaproteobacteria bacterium]TAF41648.1 MAG: UDP-N-acetylmuramate--L-alanine ligase [Alphaproteobacteria bacterium]TAF76494.1 MAG: UDP-N-acetylmuramate--L-alanine ligase [Alphaproteobacteria bacterium]
MTIIPLKKLPIAHTLPHDVGLIHIVGVGGIGMSGVAEVLHSLGYKVQGSDIAENGNITRLRGMGMTVHIGHEAENVNDAAVVVISSAIKHGNPEVEAAQAARIPVIKRADMLAELVRLKMTVAIAGTHGKTTTTSLTAALMEHGGFQPTVINGGIINAYGTNARVGAGAWMVVEADESDGTFTRLPATIAIVTNIDPEHLDYYGSFDALKKAFKQFLENIPFYGFCVLCLDHPMVQELVGQVSDRRIITYGMSAQADVRALDIHINGDGQVFTVQLSDYLVGQGRRIEQIFLPMHGVHNVSNALASIAVALELGMSETLIRSGLGQFSGVKRRFTRTGCVDGVTIVDDYGHHPVEIVATLKSARQAAGSDHKVIAVIQPHRYTRLRDLFQDFCVCANEADYVIVTEIYAAGEQPIEGISRDALVAGMRQHGHHHVRALESEHDLAATIADIAQEGDYVICLGAGSISAWANALPSALQEYMGSQPAKVGS